MHRKAPEGQILNFQNTFDRTCDEIRMEIQTENFFGSLISTKLLASHRTTKNVSNKENLHYYSTVNVGGYEPTTMHILSWTDCVRLSAGKISYIDIF
jgi:hypothetical protein